MTQTCNPAAGGRAEGHCTFRAGLVYTVDSRLPSIATIINLGAHLFRLYSDHKSHYGLWVSFPLRCDVSELNPMISRALGATGQPSQAGMSHFGLMKASDGSVGVI